MSKCLIGLGSNLDDRQVILANALTALDQAADMHLLRASALHETQPVGGPSDQPNFLNGAALFETTLDALSVLRLLQSVEDQLGRVRKETWGPRTLDLDLLLFNDQVNDSPILTLPHPRMAWRRFVLEPAAEVVAKMVHPTTGWTVGQLLDNLNRTPRYVALVGGIGAGKTRLAHDLSQRKEVKLILESFDSSLLSGFYEHPARHAKRVELEFLRQRIEQLWPSQIEDGTGRWVISDFWFDQSAAFARVWLDAAKRDAFLKKWSRKREKVAQPRLVVFLDPPMDRLFDRLVNRGRPCEQKLQRTRLEQIHRSIAGELAKPEIGPVLRLTGDDPEKDLIELTAALDAME